MKLEALSTKIPANVMEEIPLIIEKFGIDGQGSKIEKLEVKVDVLQDAVRRCDSSLSSATTKLSTLNQLGKIQNIK